MRDSEKGVPNPIEAHTKVFSILQEYNRLNLLKPVEVDHMWNAATKNKA